MKKAFILLISGVLLVSCSKRGPSYDELLKQNGELLAKIDELKLLNEGTQKELQDTIAAVKEGSDDILGYLQRIVIEFPTLKEKQVGVQWIVFSDGSAMKYVYLHLFEMGRHTFFHVPIWGDVIYSMYYEEGETPAVTRFNAAENMHISLWAAGEDSCYLKKTAAGFDIMHSETPEITPYYNEETGEYESPDYIPQEDQLVESVAIDPSKEIFMIKPVIIDPPGGL
jgi:hypothetical protein